MECMQLGKVQYCRKIFQTILKKNLYSLFNHKRTTCLLFQLDKSKVCCCITTFIFTINLLGYLKIELTVNLFKSTKTNKAVSNLTAIATFIDIEYHHFLHSFIQTLIVFDSILMLPYFHLLEQV
jgi:hypothetical protein